MTKRTGQASRPSAWDGVPRPDESSQRQEIEMTKLIERREYDWRTAILDAALPELTENGCVVVRFAPREAPQVVSRLYKLADYSDSRECRRVACGQQTRRFNADLIGANFYVVQRATGGYVVWTGMSSFLIEVEA